MVASLSEHIFDTHSATNRSIFNFALYVKADCHEGSSVSMWGKNCIQILILYESDCTLTQNYYISSRKILVVDLFERG